MIMYSLLPYITENGVDVIAKWLDSLRDHKAEARILSRLEFLRNGHFGDAKPVGDSVWELRIDVGQGYRIYYSRIGKEVILLLAGGDKRSQSRDIEQAVKNLRDYRRSKL